jgi:hypothetical protein
MSTSDIDKGLEPKTVRAGDTVLLRLPNGDVRGVKIEKNS